MGQNDHGDMQIMWPCPPHVQCMSTLPVLNDSVLCTSASYYTLLAECFV